MDTATAVIAFGVLVVAAILIDLALPQRPNSRAWDNSRSATQRDVAEVVSGRRPALAQAVGIALGHLIGRGACVMVVARVIASLDFCARNSENKGDYAKAEHEEATMRNLALLAVVLVMAGCGSPAGAPTLAATEVQVAEATSAPPATRTATATSTPTATHTTTGTPTSTTTPTATTSETSAPVVDASAWRLHVGAAALTVAAIDEIERIADARQAGTLEGIDVSGRLLGIGAVLKATSDALAEYAGGGRPDRYTAPLRDNITGTLQVIGRWLNGETTSATVASELAPMRAASEQTLSEIMAELRRLGVSQAKIDEFLTEIDGVFAQE